MKIYPCLAWLMILGAVTTSCSKDDEGGDMPSEERYTGDAYKDLHSPWVENPSQKTHLTRWDCILFGSYPANEVVSDSLDAVDDRTTRGILGTLNDKRIDLPLTFFV